MVFRTLFRLQTAKRFAVCKNFPPVLAVLLLASCASVDVYAPVDNLVSKNEFPRSVELLESSKKTMYREKDKVLYYLDKGMLSHYAGNWAVSSSLLQDGERAIEENFAVSITQEIGTYILNDKSREYDGEDYEDVYLNVFNALNYYQRGSTEDALVEIRRMNNKLKNLSVKYGVIMTNLQKKALDSDVAIPKNPDTPKDFSNSALARYLGALFYRGEGAMDDARIDRDQLKIAFADYPALYNHAIPSSINGELEIPRGMARLNVLGFSGRLPVKKEEIIRIPLGSRWIKIALPVLHSLPSQTASITVNLDGGEQFDLELLEDMGKTAEAAFTRKKDIIYVKTVIRATIKGMSSVVLGAIAESKDGDALFSILSLGAQVFAEASELADLRSSRYFPGKAYVGAINLEPGTYSFTVTYYGNNRAVIAERRFEDIRITANKLILMETVCLK